MSLAFWLELFIALALFAGFIVFVISLKAKQRRRVKAQQLRDMLIPELQALLPALMVQLFPDEIGTQSYSSNNLAIGRVSEGLTQLLYEPLAIFSQERVALSAFSSALESLLPSFQSGELTREAAQELILLGQRAMHEMIEHGH